jgi:resuscitation-promoting factor RpfA
MTEPRDEELSGIYRDAEARSPSQRVDDNVLAASQRVAGARRKSAGAGFARRWGTPLALTATVLVTAMLTFMVFERQSALDLIAPKAPRAARPAKAAPPAPPRADPSVTPPPVVLQPIAPAPPIPQTASPRDQAQQRPGGNTAASTPLGTGQPAIPEVPRAPEVLRRREEAKSSPAAPAANLPGERAGAGQQTPPVPDARRAFDVQPRTRPLQAPAAAPVPGANGLRESGSTLQGAGAVGGIASRPAAPEARERPPEKWLEDIRRLKIESKAPEAELELAEFRKRYPDYLLPEDLR